MSKRVSAVKGEADLALPPRPRCLFPSYFVKLFSCSYLLQAASYHEVSVMCGMDGMRGAYSSRARLPVSRSCTPTTCLEEPPAATGVP